MSSAIFTEGLTKDFSVGFWRRRPHRALDGLSLNLPCGEVFGLLGPNGAGKSTTLKLLLNLLWPTAGRAEVFGHPPGALAARRRLGFLPENPTFYDHLTAEELVVYFAGLCGERGAAARKRAAALLDRVGLDADRRRPLRQFSKGMLQRVGLAQALVNDPELIVLDEPMSGLDPIGRHEVRQIILRLREEGRTVLFSSHVLSDAELLCSRVAILSKGKLVASGLVSELRARHGGRLGWEIVVSDLPAHVADALFAKVRHLTRIAEGRYVLEVPPETRPEALIAELASTGAQLVSVNPVASTLEDVFLDALRNPGTPA